MRTGGRGRARRIARTGYTHLMQWPHHNPHQSDGAAGHAHHRSAGASARQAEGHCRGDGPRRGQSGRAGAQDADRAVPGSGAGRDGDAGRHAGTALRRRDDAAEGRGQFSLPAAGPDRPADYRHSRAQGGARERCGPGVDGARVGASAARGRGGSGAARRGAAGVQGAAAAGDAGDRFRGSSRIAGFRGPLST